MSKAPSMPLFCDAYLADTMDLSLEEHGAYLKLLMVTWRNNGQPLPDDPARVARFLGVTQGRWKDRLRPMLVRFFDISDGFLRQKRLEKEWQHVTAAQAVSRANGTKGGRPNSLKDKETENPAGYSQGNPQETRTEPGSKPSQPQPHIEEKRDVDAAREGVAGDLVTDRPNAVGPASAPAAGKPWLKIIRSFDAAIVEVLGPERKRLNPAANDEVTAQRWYQSGLTEDDHYPWFISKMGSANSRGKNPPRSLAAYGDDITVLLADKARPIVVASAISTVARPGEVVKDNDCLRSMGVKA